MGLGFNGSQLLAIAIGGCLCNDLQYTAEKLGITIRDLAVDVSVTITGEPLIAESAEVRLSVTAEDPGADIDGLIAAATKISAVGNSLQRGFPSASRDAELKRVSRRRGNPHATALPRARRYR